MTLIPAEQLLTLIGTGPSPLIIDASFDLTDAAAGRRSHLAGHLPGAVYLHLDSDLCGTRTGRNGRHPLPNHADFAATLGRIGLLPGRLVVALDAQGGMYAARVWWMLRWMGHAEVAVLDGGVAAWQASGGALSSQPTAMQPVTPYPLRPALTAQIDADGVARRTGRWPLIDARAGERFRGEVEPLDAAAGHIPGATNRFFKDNLAPDGRFKPLEQLKREFHALYGRHTPAAEVMHSCGSGVTACHNLLAMEHAGLAGSMLYPGSWSEWSADPARPIAQG